MQFHLKKKKKSATFSSERKQFATGPFLMQGYPLALGFAATPCICHKKAVFSSCLSVVACLHFNVSLHLLSRACRTYPATYAPKTPADTLEHSSETKVALPMAKNICKTIFSAFILWYFIASEMICVYLHTSKESSSLLASTEYPIPMDYTDNSFTLKRNNMKKKSVIKFVVCLVDCDCVIPFQSVSGC